MCAYACLLCAHREALDVVVEGVDAAGGNDARLPHGAAHLLLQPATHTHTFQQNALSIQLRWLCCTQFTACPHIKGQLYATVVGVCAFEFEFEFFARRTAMRGR